MIQDCPLSPTGKAVVPPFSPYLGRTVPHTNTFEVWKPWCVGGFPSLTTWKTCPTESVGWASSSGRGQVWVRGLSFLPDAEISLLLAENGDQAAEVRGTWWSEWWEVSWQLIEYVTDLSFHLLSWFLVGVWTRRLNTSLFPQPIVGLWSQWFREPDCQVRRAWHPLWVGCRPLLFRPLFHPSFCRNSWNTSRQEDSHCLGTAYSSGTSVWSASLPGGTLATLGLHGRGRRHYRKKLPKMWRMATRGPARCP